MAMASTPRAIPLTCSGHTRPVVDLQFSRVMSDGSYYMISACKGIVFFMTLLPFFVCVALSIHMDQDLISWS